LDFERRVWLSGIETRRAFFVGKGYFFITLLAQLVVIAQRVQRRLFRSSHVYPSQTSDNAQD
jgi:hypothetical protein